VCVGDRVLSPAHLSAREFGRNELDLAALGETAVHTDNVELRLFEYRWPLRNQSEMPFVKEVRTDASGNFDFGALQEGHYTLVIDWPSEFGDRFDIEIKKLPKSTSSVRIDVSPANSDCTGGHTIDVLSE
jgi:hypothetical protein